MSYHDVSPTGTNIIIYIFSKYATTFFGFDTFFLVVDSFLTYRKKGILPFRFGKQGCLFHMSHSFVQKELFTSHLSFLFFDHLLDHITADRSVLSGSKVSVVSVC